MKTISLDLRRRIIDAYMSSRSGGYRKTAKIFGVGEATVNRLINLYRATGDVVGKPRGGNHPRAVDLKWLKANARKYPDARLADRIDAWQEISGRKVSIGAMWNAMRAIGWTHKKRRP